MTASRAASQSARVNIVLATAAGNSLASVGLAVSRIVLPSNFFCFYHFCAEGSPTPQVVF
jgi:hypothetical protein